MKTLLILLSGVSLAFSAQARAAIVIEDFSFAATTPGPITSHSGTFSLSHDTTLNTYTLVALSYTSLPTDFTEANSQLYTSPAVPLSPGVYLISGGPNGAFIAPGGDDFSFTFDPVTPLGLSFGYVVDNPVFAATSFTVTRLNAALPEPASWALMLFGFGAVGFALRRARTATVPSMRQAVAP